jgi:hypothetical protein
LPEPFTPAKGFSCSRADQAVLLGDLLQHRHHQLLVIEARFELSNTGATSN